MNYFLKFNVNDLGELQCNKVVCDSLEIPYDLLRNEIGNIIQYVYHVDLGSEKLALVVDEEGLVNGLKPTFWLYSEERNYVDKFPLVGNILVVRLDGENTICLSEEDIEIVKSKVMVDKRSNRYFLPLNDRYIERSNNTLKELFGDVINRGDL